MSESQSSQGNEPAEETVLEEQLRACEQRFGAIVDRATDGIAVVDANGVVLFANPAMSRMIGRRHGTLVGTSLGLPVVPGQTTEVEVVGRDRTVSHAEMQVVRTSWDGAPALLAMLRDVTTRYRVTAELAHRATHDHLTQLPNRFLLNERLSHACARVKRDGVSIGVLFVDLNDFHKVNDDLGHSAGDRVLEEVGRRLHSAVRESDIAARWGGDEFVVLCEPADGTSARAVAWRLVQTVSRPMRIEGRLVTVEASVGAAVTDDPGVAPDTFLRAADELMYRSKGTPGAVLVQEVGRDWRPGRSGPASEAVGGEP